MSSLNDGDVLAAAEELRILMLIVGKLAGRDIERRLSQQGVELSPMQFGVIRLLNFQNHTISEMSKKMMITPATLVPVIDTLERHGYLKREQDPHDRRRTPLSLTDEGRRIISEVHTLDFDHALYKCLDRMGQAKCDQLVVLMRELAALMSGNKDIASGIAKDARNQVEIIMHMMRSAESGRHLRAAEKRRPHRTMRRFIHRQNRRRAVDSNDD